MVAVDGIEILLIEDNPHDAELILRGLRHGSLAAKAHVLKDGAEAVDFIFGAGVHTSRRMEDSPKLILMDLKLPKADGLDVLRKIKSDDRTRIIPVVVLSSSEEKRDIVESFRLGANSYVIKPINSEEFFDCVSQLGSYWMTRNKIP